MFVKRWKLNNSVCFRKRGNGVVEAETNKKNFHSRVPSDINTKFHNNRSIFKKSGTYGEERDRNFEKRMNQTWEFHLLHGTKYTDKF